jgi:rhodanese-related sulfurtransferase
LHKIGRFAEEETLMREIDVDTLADQLAEGGVLVDVRTPQEYAEVHVPGAVLLPLDELSGRLAELDKEQPLYVICRSGHRSAAVCEALEPLGYDAVNVTGGTIAWVRAGLPYGQGH